MQFERNSCYDFIFDRFVEKKGIRYLQLTYEGKTSMPEYEEEDWRFWVKAETFQSDLTDDDLEGQTIRCLVTGYMNDDHSGFTTTFPKLVQDKKWLLEGFYQIGETYSFTILQVPGDLHRTRNKETGDYQDVPVPEGTYYVLDPQYGYEHRFTSKKKHERNENIELTIKKIGPQWLDLQIPKIEVVLEGVQKLDDPNTIPREGNQLEYKSSFVFPPAKDKGTKSEPCIDVQLDQTIMKEIASFMNAEGGVLWIGRRDDGSVCGFNEDIPLLNSSTQDDFTYQLNMDGVELKIRNRASIHLGSFAVTLISSIEFFEDNGLYVLKLTILSSPQPVFYDNKFLYCRSGNRCLNLTGQNLLCYCNTHFKGGLVQPSEEKKDGIVEAAPGESLEPFPPEMKKVIHSPQNSPSGKKGKSKFITFYRDCSASCGSKPVNDKDTDFTIELTHEYCNAKSRLLLCYDNGHVNILKINEVLEQLGGRNKQYANRLNKEQNLLPFKCLIAHSEDYLLIRSRLRQDGTRMVKLVAVENYAGHTNMATKGNKLVDEETAEIYDMKIVAPVDFDRYKVYYTKAKNSSPGFVEGSI